MAAYPSTDRVFPQVWSKLSYLSCLLAWHHTCTAVRVSQAQPFSCSLWAFLLSLSGATQHLHQELKKAHNEKSSQPEWGFCGTSPNVTGMLEAKPKIANLPKFTLRSISQIYTEIHLPNQTNSALAKSGTSSLWSTFLWHPLHSFFEKGTVSSSIGWGKAVLVRSLVRTEQSFQVKSLKITLNNILIPKARRTPSFSPWSPFSECIYNMFRSVFRRELTEEASSHGLQHSEDGEEVECCINAFKSVRPSQTTGNLLNQERPKQHHQHKTEGIIDKHNGVPREKKKKFLKMCSFLMEIRVTTKEFRVSQWTLRLYRQKV